MSILPQRVARDSRLTYKEDSGERKKDSDEREKLRSRKGDQQRAISRQTGITGTETDTEICQETAALKVIFFLCDFQE